MKRYKVTINTLNANPMDVLCGLESEFMPKDSVNFVFSESDMKAKANAGGIVNQAIVAFEVQKQLDKHTIALTSHFKKEGLSVRVEEISEFSNTSKGTLLQ